MLMSLCAAGIVIGLAIGRRSSYRVLLIATPAIGLLSAVMLYASGGTWWAATALGPVVAVQIAFFAGAQIRIDAARRSETAHLRAGPVKPLRATATAGRMLDADVAGDLVPGKGGKHG